MRKTRILALAVAIMAFAAFTAFSQKTSNDVITHPVVKERPNPGFPNSISKSVDCTIVLRVLFRSDGKVTSISLYEVRRHKEGLSSEDVDKLTKSAEDAAERIKFVPGTKNGKPVSWWMELEYRFQNDNDNFTTSA